MTQKKQAKIYDIIAKLLLDSPEVSWGDIMTAIKAEMDIKNWLDVRGCVQGLKDTDLITRTDDLHNENYVAIVSIAKFQEYGILSEN